MTCSIFSCCNGEKESRTEPPQHARGLDRKGAVLLLASSDVLHAIRSPHVKVVFLDVRPSEQFRKLHIEDALSLPCETILDLDAMASSRAIQSTRDKITPGALLAAFGAATKPTHAVGTCVVVYDSIGDTAEAFGRAAVFSQLLVDLEIVPEVGRIAGGFQAFRELNAATSSATSAWALPDLNMDSFQAVKPSHAHSLYERPESVSSRSSSSSQRSTSLSQAGTPRSATALPIAVEMQTFSLDGHKTASASSAAALGRARPQSGSGSKWKVSIGVEPQEVPPACVMRGLFLGNKGHVSNIETLRQLGVTHILNVSRDSATPFADEMVYCSCYVADSVSSDLSVFFDQAFDFIDAARSSSTANAVLVHCAGGVSRSTSIVTSYLMRKERMPLKQALEQIRRVHPAAAPNSAFIHQLIKLEQELGLTSPSMLAATEQMAPSYSSKDLASMGDGFGQPSLGAAAGPDSAHMTLALAPSALAPSAVAPKPTACPLDLGVAAGGVGSLSWQDYNAAPPTPSSRAPPRGARGPKWGDHLELPLPANQPLHPASAPPPPLGQGWDAGNVPGSKAVARGEAPTVALPIQVVEEVRDAGTGMTQRRGGGVAALGDGKGLALVEGTAQAWGGGQALACSQPMLPDPPSTPTSKAGPKTAGWGVGLDVGGLDAMCVVRCAVDPAPCVASPPF